MKINKELYLIYIVINKIDSKKYIGQTKVGRLKRRIHEHILDIPYTKKTSYFHNALNKYGIDNFDIQIVETNIPEDLIDEKEKYYIKKYNTYYKNGNGYNMTFGGQGTHGYKFTLKDRQKISVSSKKYWEKLKANPIAYQKALNRLSENSKNHTVSIEARNRLRQAHLGKDPWNKGAVGLQKAWNKNSNNGNAVNMYNLETGEYIQTFNNIFTAARYLFKDVGEKLINTYGTRIGAVCSVNKGHAYGYIWRYERNSKKIKLSNKELNKEHISPRARAIQQFSLDNRLIAEYESAAAYSKIISSEYRRQRQIAKAIADACNERAKTAYGFIWKYKNNIIK